MIKAVFFDLDDTLFDSSGSSEKFRKGAIDAMIDAGLPAKSVDEAYIALMGIIKQHGSNNENHFNFLCEYYGVKEPAPVVAAGIVAYHEMKVTLHPFAGTAPMLLHLIKKGYKLALITNGISVKQWDKIIRLRIKDYFDLISVSDNHNTTLNKEVRIKDALRKLVLSPQEVAFVGDKLQTDIESAKRCGLFAIRLLHGSHRNEEPHNQFQNADITISSISEVPAALQELEKLSMKH